SAPPSRATTSPRPRRPGSSRCWGRGRSGTRAGRRSASTARSPAGATFGRDRWELHHTDQDPTETHDLAAEHPEKLQELVSLWFHEAGQYAGRPLEDRTAVEVLADPTRPQVAPHATSTSTSRIR